MADMKKRTVVLTREPVALFKVLKFENLAASGGEAKHFIDQGRVRVNGLVETRKHRKIRAGDEIAFDGMLLCMVSAMPQI
ncbi:MAG TPA: RNA-binding S4 domain-containing protein [Desulfotignum sp.]|jgi:ribosome-associated protein|nr:RNA-binding S4 domain-containing protein [Desulfotignum sp.]